MNHAGSKSSATIKNTVFFENTSDQEGRALWAGGASANLDLTMEKVTFQNNQAGLIADADKNETAGGLCSSITEEERLQLKILQ